MNKIYSCFLRLLLTLNFHIILLLSNNQINNNIYLVSTLFNRFNFSLIYLQRNFNLCTNASIYLN